MMEDYLRIMEKRNLINKIEKRVLNSSVMNFAINIEEAKLTRKLE